MIVPIVTIISIVIRISTSTEGATRIVPHGQVCSAGIRWFIYNLVTERSERLG